MSNSRGDRFWLAAWWPVALAILLVAISSTAGFGADRMSSLLAAILKEFHSGPISHAHWFVLVVAIRKSCHFIGYGIIGLVFMRAWRLTFPRFRRITHTAFAVIGAGLIASCDEFHQTFIPNRTGSPWDVLIDCSGALVMCLIVLRFARANRRRRVARASQPWHVPSQDVTTKV